MNELAFNISPYGEVGQRIDELLALSIKSCGIGELYPTWYYKSETPNPSVESITREIQKRKVKVVSVHGVGGFVAKDSSRQGDVLPHLKSEVDRAAEWNSPVIVFHFRAAYMPCTRTEMADWTAVIGQMGVEKYDTIFHETLVKLCDHAAKRGVTVHLETMGPPFSYGCSVDQMLPTLRKLNHKHLGVCADAAHLYCSDHNPAEQIRLTKGFPLTLHLNDNLGPIPPNYDIYDSDLHLVIGFGTIDWVQVILSLRAVDYRGPFFVEGGNYPGGSFKQAAEMTIRNWLIFESLADSLASRWLSR